MVVCPPDEALEPAPPTRPEDSDPPPPGTRRATMASSSNIVVEWLRSLHLGQYAESFLDNGYDDLEICKQVGDPDLDAIGVFNPTHRGRLLGSVRALREEGAASVYFTLEEAAPLVFHDEADTASGASGVSSRTSSATGRPPSACDREATRGPQSGILGGGPHVGPQGHSPAPSSAGSAHELGKYLDEYEEGKAELVRIPRALLRKLLREKLLQDGIRLSHQPYSTADGERGYLEGLAARYAALYRTHHADVLEHLELLRRREWADMSPRIRVLGGPPESPSASPGLSMGLAGLHQPIYIPGKYSPSSCLSDREEDEIYGMAGMGPHARPPATYQTCLSPRSAYFYELPPNEAAGRGKKRTALSRLLRGLRSKGRTARPARPGRRAAPHQGTLGHPLGHPLGHHTLGHHTLQHCSPRRGQQIYARVTTPDGDAAHVPQFLDLQEYEGLQLLQTNGGPGPGGPSPRGPQADFEETIHRLKIQDALRQKERYHREHEEILRDIRQGLLRLDPEPRADDTYMYDTELMVARAGQSTGSLMSGAGPSGASGPAGPGGLHLGHWYDEPPYESDPEDFLMTVPPGTVVQNGRACLTLNLRPAVMGEGVITLRSAGDISVGGGGPPGQGPGLHGLHGLHGLTAVPVRLVGTQRPPGRAGRTGRPRAGVPAGLRGTSEDVHNVSSQLSAISIGYPWDQHPALLKKHQYRCRSSQSEGTLSPCRSPDLPEPQPQQEAQPRSSSLVGRMRGLRQDVQRKICRLRGLAGQAGQAGLVNSSSGHRDRGEAAIPLGPLPGALACSVESLPSGSSTQPLVREASSEGPLDHVIGKARALVDHVPSPYDKDALRFKKGDVIDVVSMSPSGMWRGRANGCVGHFKFINVEVMPQRAAHTHHKGRPQSVEELLRRIGLEECISVFVLNGYEDIESFKDLREEDLDYLGIKSTETRAKVRAAIRLLHDYDCNTDHSHGETDSGGEDDEDDVDEDDSSSGSELGLGRPGQPQPLPLSGKFPPGLRCVQQAQGAQARPAGSVYYCGDISRREDGLGAGQQAGKPLGHGSPGLNIPAIDSYVVARKGGRGVSVEPGPRHAAPAPPPAPLPRTGSASSRGRAGPAESSQGAALTLSPSASSLGQGLSPGAAPAPESALEDGGDSPDTVGLDKSVLRSLGDAKESSIVSPEESVVSGSGVDAPTALPVVNGAHGAGDADRERGSHERSSDSGVSSSSSQPSSSSSRDRESRRERRTMAMAMGAGRQ